ncbi:MAG: hypothetical protein D6B26_00625, partial [Spirochaetaceae bacterium]
GMSDLTDLLTCLCLYAVEAEKIRLRFEQSELLEALVSQSKAEGAEASEFMMGLGFSADEANGLVRIWPQQTLARVLELVRHREMFHLDIRKQTNNWNSRRTDLWTAQIGQAMRDTIGFDPSELPADRRVHIISSNTHSVSNCLNPWFAQNRADVLSWAKERQHHALQEEWHNESDLAYAMMRDYFKCFPEKAREAALEGRGFGIYTLQETASTGIQVQIIDCAALAGAAIDPDVIPVPAGNTDIIINIDYAFGQQAEHIMRNLVMLFGSNVASINFFGKAGTLYGARGDILVPTAFIEQTSDLFQPLPQPASRVIADLENRLPGRQVHVGPMLTVEGTLMQNRMMLHFYRRIWNCAGLEMEGTYYYRQVLEATQIGVIPRDVEMRFFYYVSDLPMSPDFGLASPMALSEGVPPLYAITRHILSGIFS